MKKLIAVLLAAAVLAAGAGAYAACQFDAQWGPVCKFTGGHEGEMGADAPKSLTFSR